jgi:hypothetical protein
MQREAAKPGERDPISVRSAAKKNFVRIQTRSATAFALPDTR